MDIIGDRLLATARAFKEWGTPDVLWQLLTFVLVPGPHVEKVTRFFKNIPPSQLTAPIVPVLSSQSWGSEVFAQWARSADLDPTVKKAIGQTVKRGER
jgi:predicted KAP-like P-loop ATPase